MVHLPILVIARTIRGQKIRRSVNNELLRIWKETAVFQLDTYVYTSFAQRHLEVQYACLATKPRLEPVLPKHEAEIYSHSHYKRFSVYCISYIMVKTPGICNRNKTLQFSLLCHLGSIMEKLLPAKCAG